MKVLFIFKSENFLAPIGLCVVSAIVCREGHESFLAEVNSQDVLSCVAELKPDVVAYSSSTGEAKHYLRINRKIKEKFPEIFTIMGGPHPTFFPEMINESTLDCVCQGEGEGALADILKALSVGRNIDDIPNIITKRNLRLSRNRVRHLIEDLDSLPFPDYGLLYDNTPMGNYPLKNFMIGRGCPYQCTYCFNPAWNKLYQGKGKIIRRHSVDYVIEDIERVMRKWPLSNVKFYDDIFTYEADDWLVDFATKYKKRIGLPFFILTRADLLTEDMVKLLKYAGCRTISMSIEAGNPEVRNNLLKRNMTDEQIIKAHLLCKKYGIRTFTNCIIALPNTNINYDIESINLSIKCKVDWVEYLIFHPYPGTTLGNQVINMGIYTPDYDKMHTSYMHHSPLKCFSKREKNAQMNISALGAVATVIPSLKNLIVNRLIYWPHNKFFTIAYYLIKMWIIRHKIYETKTSFAESIKIYLRSFRQEFFRHEKSDLITENE